LLAFDLRCIGPYTCDAVASALLSLAVGLVSQGINVSGLYDVESGRLLALSDPHRVLAYAVDRVLDSKIVEELDLYEYIEPLTMEEIRRVLREVAGVSMDFTSGLPRGVSRFVVCATSLLHATGEILDLASSIVKSRGSLSLVVPAEPWLDARDNLMAEKMRVSFQRAVKRLSSMGVSVVPWRSAPRTLVLEASA